MPHSNGPRNPAGTQGSAPKIPLPGQHLTVQPADPDRIRGDVDDLLAELDGVAADEGTETGVDLTRRAHILEQAHEVLVRALATVDKI
ncbi:hypothetical protein [Nocardia sp. CNY236]|uniref:hypothetical protein n=1 Tax=Nocardia sp. CNY236 TaxID=1169152 RepID=UPI00041C914F|nr:hypothetical protein [Nocardia sp. CNY236]